jgi:GNAT superfamily N-acetyltransferase
LSVVGERVTIEIRRAKQDDVGAFVALHREVQELHVAARPDQFKAAEPSALEARFDELFASPDAKIWVAELDGGVVGYAVSLHQRRPAFTAMPAREWCEIDQIAVTSAHRRRGIATALIQAIIADARLSGLHDIELNSWAFNQDAHLAFRRLGFQPKAIRFELKG